MDGLILAYVLIGAGFLLMVAELFIPSGGILSVLCVVALAVGVWLTFDHNTRIGWWTLLGVFILVPTAGMLLFRLWPHTPIGKRFFLQARPDESATALMAAHEELEDLRGKTGKTLSTLRPSGMVDFDGRRVDCIADAMMIPEGEWVKCVEVRAGKVLVRPADKPRTETFEDMNFG